MYMLTAACTSSEQKSKNTPVGQAVQQDTLKNEAIVKFSFPAVVTDVANQYFEVNPNKRVTIQGQQGTKIIFPKGCFKNELGRVTITLREYYTIGDILLGGLSTTADQKLLETDGMIYIEATNHEGKQLSLEDTPCKIEMPSKKRKNDMKIFEGEKTEKGINWKLVKNKSIEYISYPSHPVKEGGSITQEQKELQDYIFQTTQLGWINCDRFLTFENTVELVVELPRSEEGLAYTLVFYNYNSILRGYPDTLGQLVFKGLPPGEKVTLLGIGVKDGELYYSLLDLTTDTQGAKVSDLRTTTKEAFQMLVGGKFGNSLAERPSARF